MATMSPRALGSSSPSLVDGSLRKLNAVITLARDNEHFYNELNDQPADALTKIGVSLSSPETVALLKIIGHQVSSELLEVGEGIDPKWTEGLFESWNDIKHQKL